MFSRRFIAWLLVLACCGISFSDEKIGETEFPVLFYINSTPPSGGIENFRLGVHKTGTQSPVSVAFSEDTPVGVGDEMRAALWMAVTTVALERNTTLMGYKIEVTTRGRVDGPSAGGMFTLALMTALDGKRIPNDVAFTGTILPDGSVGVVEGVPFKIKAAVKAGKKRVLVPKYQRTDIDLVSNTTVDLKELCQNLKVEYVPVANVRDAYAAIQGQSVQKAEIPEVRISDALDTFYANQYKQNLRLGDTAWDAIPRKVKADMAKDAPEITAPRDNALSAFNMNNAPAAAYYSTLWRFTAIGIRSMVVSVEAVGPDAALQNGLQDAEKRIELLMTTLERAVTNAAPASIEYLQPVVSSVLDDLARIALLRASLELPALDDQKLSEIVGVLLLWPHALPVYFTVLQEFSSVQPLYPRTLSAKPAVLDATGDFINKCYLAHHAYLKSCVLSPMVKDAGLGLTDDQLLLAVFQEDQDLAIAYAVSPLIQEQMHSEWQNSSMNERLLAVHLYLENIAKSAAQIMKHESQFQQAASDERMMAFIRSAREQALLSISEAMSAGIPCVQPISSVYIADAMRDKQTESKTDVLSLYVFAGLQAKVGRMIFTK